MIVTEFSFMMAVLWSSVILLSGALLTRSKRFVSWFGISGFLLVTLAGVLRLVLPVEILGVAIVEDTAIMPAMQRILRVELFGGAVSLGGLLFALWALGSILYLSFYIFKVIRQKQAVRKLPAGRSYQYEKIMNEIAGGKKYRLLVSDSLGSPAMTGLLVPTILMPDITLTDTEAEYVLRHEWYHFRHGDLWKKLLFNVLCSFLWWNPLMYFIRGKLDYILEISCDYHVVKGQSDRKRVDYVESTLSVVRQITQAQSMPCSVAFADAASPNDLTRRCELILFPPKSHGLKAKAASAMLLLCLLALSYSFIIQPSSPTPVSIGDDFAEIEFGPDNSYLHRNSDGTYTLFVNNEEWGTVLDDELKDLPYSVLQIK